MVDFSDFARKPLEEQKAANVKMEDLLLLAVCQLAQGHICYA